MFDELKEREPNHFAVRQYAKYKLAAGKTAKSILVSCGARLAVFDIAELREVTAYDELELDTLGDRRTALFLIMSDTDDSFNFLISMCYTQLFNLLCEKADDVYGGRLPSMCGASSTSAPTSARSPSWKSWSPPSEAGDFRLPGIAGTEPAQGHLQGQRRHHHRKYGFFHLSGRQGADHAQGAGSCAGQGNIDTYNTGESRGRETSHSLNYQKLGKALMSQDELAVMGRRQVHLAAARGAAVFVGQVRHHPAPQLQVHR